MKTITLLTFTLYFSLNVHAQWTNNSNVTTSNIGIGIVPENPLHVYKTTGGRVFSTESGGTNTGITIKGTAKTYELWTSSSIPNNGFGIYDYNAKKYRISIDGSSGNVGIGLNNPQQPLDVNNTLRVSFGDNLHYGNVELGATSGTRARSGSIYFNSYVNEYNSTQAIQAAYIGYTNDDYLYYETSNGRAHSFGGGNVEIDNELMLGGAFSPGNNAGTSGQLLQSTGSATTPIWVDSAATTAKFVDGTDPSNAVFVNGNVGIGTTTPMSRLSLGSDSGNYGTASAKKLAIYSDATGNNFYGLGVSSGNGFDSSLEFHAGAYISQDDSPGMVLTVSKNVGIGTGTPSEKLEVIGTIRASSSATSTTSGYVELTSNSSNNSGWVDFYNWDGAALDRAGYIGYANDDYIKYTTYDLRNHYFSGGNVGIGTSSTGSHKLAVEGSIGAREIKVEDVPNWSDFVFEDDYELPTLVEVEMHIKVNGHLKDIPSAEEVKEDGIYLGQMDAKLLQKIEELTLYLIDQNKRLDAQQKEIEELKAQTKD